MNSQNQKSPLMIAILITRRHSKLKALSKQFPLKVPRMAEGPE
jgi:hypothetical protein